MYINQARAGSCIDDLFGGGGGGSWQVCLDSDAEHGQRRVHHQQHQQQQQQPSRRPLSRVPIDAEAARTWIYPVNYPVRQYQLQIVTQALFNNTLVALPTGLGKTLIAAVVMYNFYRW